MARDRWTVLVCLFITLRIRRVAFCPDGIPLLNSGWSPLLLGYRCAETVEPLLLVVDIAHMQGVGLAVGRIRGAHTENILS